MGYVFTRYIPRFWIFAQPARKKATAKRKSWLLVDYIKKMREYLKENEFENIDFIYNNSYLFEDKIIVGTRGWQDDDNTQDKKY